MDILCDGNPADGLGDNFMDIVYAKEQEEVELGVGTENDSPVSRIGWEALHRRSPQTEG